MQALGGTWHRAEAAWVERSETGAPVLRSPSRRSERWYRAFGLFVVSAAMCTGCGDDTTGGGGSGGSAGGAGGGGAPSYTTAYDTGHVMEVAVTMSPDDFEALRLEGNDPEALLGGNCLSGPRLTEFTEFDGSVTVDGTSFDNITVRKKGFLGSLSITKPSLKIRFDAVDPEGKYLDTDRLTLNNNKQDESLVRTCLALELFAKAGAAAPRCTFAHVTVNGEDLGIYANVEHVGTSFLERSFGDGTGTLYEGQISDVRTGWVDTYEKKSNTMDPSRADIEELSALLAAPATTTADIASRVDLDGFLKFWAAESALGAWDGYANNQNNHFVYHDPTTDKLFYIPWSPDMTFVTDDPFSPGDRPASVSAWGALPNRLYQDAAVRDDYRQALLTIVSDVLDPATVTAEIDRMQALLEPYVDTTSPSFQSSMDEVRSFVNERADVLSAEVAAGPAPWPYPLRSDPCLVNIGTVSGSFSTTVNSLDVNIFLAGTGSVTRNLTTVMDTTSTGGAACGEETSRMFLQIVGSNPVDFTVVVLYIDKALFTPGASIKFDWQQGFGVVGHVDPATENFVLQGILNAGSVQLTKASTGDGAEVEGTFEADVLGGLL
ncbi:MAG: CotH kinase family protein [Polyangiaceae bacterium]